MCDTFLQLELPTADCCCTWATSTKSHRRHHLSSRCCLELDEVPSLSIRRVVCCLLFLFDVRYHRTHIYCLLFWLHIRFLCVLLRTDYPLPSFCRRRFHLLLQIWMTMIFSRWSSWQSTTTMATTFGGTKPTMTYAWDGKTGEAQATDRGASKSPMCAGSMPTGTRRLGGGTDSRRQHQRTPPTH